VGNVDLYSLDYYLNIGFEQKVIFDMCVYFSGITFGHCSKH
jgi:hypothetical protein